MKLLVTTLAVITGILITAPQAHAADPLQVTTDKTLVKVKRLDCVYSPTRREWELDRGGKQCRKKALRFIRVTRSFAGYQPALSGCATTKPRRIWRCTATEFRTTNIEKGNIVAGRFVKVGLAWVVKGLRFPEPDFSP